MRVCAHGENSYEIHDQADAAKTVVVDPTEAKLGIVGWKSPVTGAIHVAGSFRDLHVGGGWTNGVRWSVDKGSRRLSSAELPDGASQSFDLMSVRIREGQVLYFVIDALGNQGTDEIGFNVKITMHP